MDDQVVSDEIVNGHLNGSVEYNEFGEYVTIADTAQAILAMIEHHDR